MMNRTRHPLRFDLASHLGRAEARRCRGTNSRTAERNLAGIRADRAKSFTTCPSRVSTIICIRRVLLEPAPSGISGHADFDYRRSLAALGVLVALVLLIACANVANLMTAQAAARAREMALRVSIGAGRWRLVQLVLVESAMLAFLAAAIGAFFAWWSAPFVVGMINPPDEPGAPVSSDGLARAWIRIGADPRP